MKSIKVVINSFIFLTLIFSFCENLISQEKIISSSDAPGEEIIELSLSDVTTLALKNNLDIKIAKLDALISGTDLESSHSIFDILLSAGANYKEDRLDKGSILLGEKTTTNDYYFNLEKKFPTGTTLNAGVSDERYFSDSPFITINPSHDAVVEFSAVQELGKNSFGLIDRSTIAMTELAVKNVDLITLDRIENSVAEAQKAYWRVALALESVALEKNMLEKARNLYRIDKDKFDLGLIEESDLLAGEANVTLRETQLLIVENELKDTIEELKLILDLKTDSEMRVKEKLGFNPVPVSFVMALKEAIEFRRDYTRAANDVKKFDIAVKLTKNSLWPQIDLAATWKRNGLDSVFSEAAGEITSQNNPYYYAGILFSVPLENTEARSSYKKAGFEKAKALLSLKKTEEEIAVDIDKAVRALSITGETYLKRLKTSELQSKKLDVEFNLFGVGRSSSFVVINYQQDLLLAEFNVIKALYDYKIARIDLKLAQNSLLNELGIE
ncbi:MAG: TolC family protein [Candidatus Omnitrophota bacterium]